MKKDPVLRYDKDKAVLIEEASLSDFSLNAFLNYALSVVKGRAIPDVCDGLKPVQRRILYTMYGLGLKSDSKPMKSARVVGQALGLYHPHGDVAAYEAMVRMAQPFSLRYPLVHGEGNFGSRDGDSAAAYRYTEAKLTPLADCILSEINWDTVDFKQNYDGKDFEPTLLPARLPILLLNGSTGIAVGLATECLPHNIVEIVNLTTAILENPTINPDVFFDYVKGPDFPNGGVLISSKDEIKKVYQEGRGMLKLRAKWHTEQLSKNKWGLVIDELPQNTSCDKVMLEINELMDPKPKEKNGKKQPLSPEQIKTKKMFNEWIESFDNHSDKANQVRILIVPKDKNLDSETLALSLCAYTSLEENIKMNEVAIDLDGTPKLNTPFEWLRQWCVFRVKTYTRKLVSQKLKIDSRIHVLNGRALVLTNIDEVIKIIKNSDNPKSELIEKFSLSEIQAEDILELKLRQIAKLEVDRLREELAKLAKEQIRLEKLLKNEKLLRKEIISELDFDLNKFQDERRTLIKPSISANAETNSRVTVQNFTSKDPIAVAISNRGWISWKNHKLDENNSGEQDFKLKTGDSIKTIIVSNRSETLLIMDELGRAYSLELSELPIRSDTLPLSQWLDLKNEIAYITSGSSGDKFLVCGENGYGFVVDFEMWQGKLRAGKTMLVLSEKEKPLQPLKISLNDLNNFNVFALSSDMRAVAFSLADVNIQPKGKGVRLIGLAQNQYLKDITVKSVNEELSVFDKKGKKLIIDKDVVNSILLGRSSSRKGKRLINKIEDFKFSK